MNGLPLFSSCSKAELVRIRGLTTRIEVQQGTVLIEEGMPGREFFIINDGRASVSRRGRWLADLGAGTFFGELALLEQGCRGATVIAETDMILLVFSRAEFNSIHEAAPTIGRKMLAEMGARLRRANALLDDVSSPSADVAAEDGPGSQGDPGRPLVDVGRTAIP